MTITTTTLRVDYTANGVNTTFAFPFPVFYESNATPKFSLQVVVTDLSNVESIKTETTDYTISYTSTDLVNGILKQGNVVLNTAPTNNFKVSILRNLNLTQNADFTDKGTDIYSGGVVESALDKLTLVSQQIQENLNRVVKLPKSSQLSGIEFPINPANANQVLAINTAGDNLTTKDLADVSLATLTNYAKTLLDDENASQARATLDAQQLNANLTALAGLTGANNKIPYFTGSGAMALRDLLATSTTQGIQALDPNKIIPISNNTVDAINDIDVGSGWFNFDDGSGQAYYAGGTGQLDVLFSAGGNGMLDASTIANTTYHIFLIHNPTTLVSKILASTSVSSPTMPSGYTKKARIGSIIRASGAILAFTQSDKRFMHRLNRLDRSTTLAAPASPTNLSLTVPSGLSIDALVTVYVQELGSVGGAVLVCDPNYTDLNASLTNFSALISTPGGSQQANTTTLHPIRTNTSAQVNIDGSNTTVSLGVITNGWIDYQLNY